MEHELERPADVQLSAPHRTPEWAAAGSYADAELPCSFQQHHSGRDIDGCTSSQILYPGVALVWCSQCRQ